MRVVIVGVLLTVLAGCGDSGNYHRGYVISQSEQDELLDESTEPTLLAP